MSTPDVIVVDGGPPKVIEVQLPGGPPGPIGPVGPPGPQGPPGASNAVYSGEWNWNNAGDASATGRVSVDQPAAWLTTTELRVNETTAGGVDTSTSLGKIGAGDGFYLQVKADASRYLKLTVTGVATDHGTWQSWPVTLDQGQGAAPTQNTPMQLSLLKAGAQVEEWLSGTGAPAGTTGNSGDWYLDTASGNVYEKTSAATWTLRSNIKGPVGPQGIQGVQGPQGIQGVAGPTGQGVPAGGAVGQILRKTSGTDYDTNWAPIPAALGRRFYGIGDSIIPGDPAINVAYNSFVGWAALLSDYQLYFEKSLAVLGAKTADVLATQIPALLAASPRPHFCVVNCGANDASGAVPLATTISNLTAIYQAVLGAGIAPVLCTITPNNNGFLAAIGQINIFIKRYARANQLAVADIYNDTVNGANGQWLATPSSYTLDGIHPNGLGAKIMGTTLWNALKGSLLPYKPYLAAVDTDPNDPTGHPLLLAGTAAAPTGYNVNTPGDATFGLAPDVGNVLGNAWTITHGATGPSFVQTNQLTAVAGDRIYFGARVNWAPAAGGTLTVVCTSWTGSKVIAQPIYQWDQGFGWQTVSGEAVLAAGGTGARITFTPTGNGSVLKVGQVTLLNLTALGEP